MKLHYKSENKNEVVFLVSFLSFFLSTLQGIFRKLFIVLRIPIVLTKVNIPWRFFTHEAPLKVQLFRGQLRRERSFCDSRFSTQYEEKMLTTHKNEHIPYKCIYYTY